MSYEHKPNSGSIFRNDKKEKEQHPDYKGSALIDGVEYWVSSWINEGKNGKYMGMSFQKKEDVHNQGVQNASNAAQPPVDDDFNDSVPF